MIDWFQDRYYDVKSFYQSIVRGIKWGYKLRYNYPWDYHFLLEFEVMKLKELLHYFENYGHHSEDCKQYKPKMKSINLAIKLGTKLLDDDYHKFYNLHYKKWGEIEIKFEKVPNETFDNEPVYRMVSYRNGQPVKENEQEKTELREAMKADDRMKERHRRWFYDIISKHGERWWD